MRYIKPESALSFLSLGQCVRIKNKVEESRKLIGDMRDTYGLLIEVKHGIYTLSEIKDEGEAFSFTVLKGKHYEAYQAALARDLVWDTIDHSPNLKQSELRWRDILCQGVVKKAFVDKIRDTVEKEPSLQDFGSDLFLYLLHCQRDEDWYAPTAEVIKISRIAGE